MLRLRQFLAHADVLDPGLGEQVAVGGLAELLVEAASVDLRMQFDGGEPAPARCSIAFTSSLPRPMPRAALPTARRPSIPVAFAPWPRPGSGAEPMTTSRPAPAGTPPSRARK